ncbi:hypothetical protein F9L33_04220 [Amylibacter sp. SFDW26]|uniref:arginine deiminase-related protein n=1 Tax=Amylibacter sp. SFDW26 TaxID=2652722 RepID=UPI001261BA39|nr:arginine deiminase-related protein [Amylibacter sp. SFDW26]KAB7615975.1 hypothetical protein F9L33_04220 [Amylibacter sp. SFDW26]
MSLQAPSSVIMIRPHKFVPKPETLADNSFQTAVIGAAADIVNQTRKEFDDAVMKLEGRGITVHIFQEDGSKGTPDTVFPNNINRWRLCALHDRWYSPVFA